MISLFAILLRRVGKKRLHFDIYDKMNMSRSIMVSDRIRVVLLHYCIRAQMTPFFMK
jgi:hypothetical protein